VTRRAVTRAATVLLVIAMLAIAWRMGWLARLAQPRSLARTLAAEGTRGYAAFLLAYALLQPFGIPGTVFVIGAALTWPWPIAFGLSMVGSMMASVIGFSFARFIARDFLAARIPARFRRYDEALERNAFRTVFLLRLIFWMPQALHFFLGVSKVRGTTHFWSSLLGYVAPLFVMSYFGARLFDGSGHMQPRAWLFIGGLVGTSAAIVVAWRALDRRAAVAR